MKTAGTAGLVWTLWGTAVIAGFLALAGYEATPGATSPPPLEWPASTAIPRASNGLATLLLFAHPKCPCTRATLKELAVALEGRATQVDRSVGRRLKTSWCPR